MTFTTMAEEDVTKQFGRLKLTKEERAKKIEVEDDDLDKTTKDLENALACRILSPKTINTELFSTNMPKIWGMVGSVQIKKEGKNTYICKFVKKKRQKQSPRRRAMEL